jgi:hypothetical protein
MATGKQSLSDQRQALFKKEGRGTGDGPDYVPGRALRDMPGIGRLHRFACSRCGGRQIVLPSDVELAVFVKEYRDPRTTDLNEHFPLLDVKKTTWLAEISGFKHPKHKDGSPAVLMTSLMVSKRQAGVFKRQAIDIVSSRAAQQTPSDENRIKGEYWRRLGVDHRIEYSTGLDGHESKHLWTLFNIAESIALHGLSHTQRHAQQAVLKQLKIRAGSTLLSLCHEAADANGIARAACVSAILELIALGIVECSLDVPILVLQKQRNVHVRIPSRVNGSGITRR